PQLPAPLPAASYVEHQKAVTIRNDVNVKKETVQIEEDEENPDVVRDDPVNVKNNTNRRRRLCNWKE
ncbi:unnamed protein product, partial [Linum tenue]